MSDVDTTKIEKYMNDNKVVLYPQNLERSGSMHDDFVAAMKEKGYTVVYELPAELLKV